MATADEEIQAKEFLKRAEIKTMRKDLMVLRESDALKERDKIAKIRTLEEQLEEKQKTELVVPVRVAPSDKAGRQEVLQRNATQERIAEKDLKNYATEQERQQIFLMESQRLGFEKQIDEIDNVKDPALKLEKNKLLLQKRDQQAKLNLILEQEKKLEDEQKFITEKSRSTTLPDERKSLEQSRWDLDKKIQEVEKKRWEVEKQIESIDGSISQIDKQSSQLVDEKNVLGDKVLGVDKLLRDIYSAVMSREEERRKGQAQDQITNRTAVSKDRAEQKEKIQREQYSGLSVPKKGGIQQASGSLQERMAKSFAEENEQRKKFLEDVEMGTNKTHSDIQQKSNIQ